MSEQEKTRHLLNIVRAMFDSIRGDWSDPRWECREGWEAVAHLREHVFDEPLGYRHVEGRTLEQFIEAHKDEAHP